MYHIKKRYKYNFNLHGNQKSYKDWGNDMKFKLSWNLRARRERMATNPEDLRFRTAPTGLKTNQKPAFHPQTN